MTVDRFGNLDSRMVPPSNESFTLKAKTSVYEVSLSQLQKLFVRELGVPEDRITITANHHTQSDGCDDRFDRQVFDGLTITVKG